MKIERATTNDNVILSEITKKSKAYWGYSEEQILKWKDSLTISKEYIDANEVFNLTIENEIIGYYSYTIKENNSVKLDNLFVLPYYIGKGFGKYLINDFLIKIQKSKFKKIVLDSEPYAEKFYQKMGFKKTGSFETSIKDRFMPIMEMIL
ncbi:GNAT family N-acetyltransferase [Flavobacterium sp.]|uniref:GNAT family N-acetyltransferase n=1 Tax=Flavobacterium sp. TaxID=239 RepID=UPI0037513D87